MIFGTAMDAKIKLIATTVIVSTTERPRAVLTRPLRKNFGIAISFFKVNAPVSSPS